MNPRLLIVEADQKVRRWLGLHLDSIWPDAQREHAAIDEAWNRLAAPAPGKPYEIVLLGLGQSESEREQAWRLLAQVRQMHLPPATLVIAGGGDERLAVTAMRRGASDYLARESLEPADLGRALKDALRRQQQRASRQPLDDPPTGPSRPERRADGVPHYRLLRTLGGSHAATVWLARSERLGRDVALKVGKAGVDDAEARRQLAEERAAIAALRHPSVVELYDYGVHDGREFLAMEYFPCADLKRRLNGPLSAPRALRFARDIAVALRAVHAAGFMHRDLKPHNVMLRADGSPVLIDFGLARALGSQTHLTAAGVLRGSPYYMSPEQVNGLPLDARSDLYSLGVMLYEMLSGHRPYIGNSALELMQQHVEGQRPRLAEELACYEPLVDRLMAVDRTQRCTTADEVIEMLEEQAIEPATGPGECGDTTRVGPATDDDDPQDSLAVEYALARRLIHCRASERRRLVTLSGRALLRIRTQLGASARSSSLFRRRLQRVIAALQRIGTLARQARVDPLRLPAERAAATLRARIEGGEPDGEALLPASADIEAVATRVYLLAELCALPLPGGGERATEAASSESENGVLADALRKRAQQVARELGKQVRVVCNGLAHVPADWHSAVFDICSQLVRNAIEHGIESPDQRLAADKPVIGQITIQFSATTDRCLLQVADDGAGLDAARIAERALSQGGLPNKPGRPDARQIVRMMFLPGLSTAEDPTGRGQGMNIVRGQLRRLGGKISVATRGGQYTRIEMELPPAPQTEAAGGGAHSERVA